MPDHPDINLMRAYTLPPNPNIRYDLLGPTETWPIRLPPAVYPPHWDQKKIVFDAIVNRIPAMVPLAALYFGLYYLEGHIFLKHWTYRVLLRHNTSPFKGACRFIYLK
jgi:hypothetical protein